jgi:predicted glycosyltransferase
MRVWIDLTNSPHVLVMRPVIAALRGAGAEVAVTARDFAQTLGVCERLGIGCRSSAATTAGVWPPRRRSRVAPEEIELRKRDANAETVRVRRDPALLVERLSAPLRRPAARRRRRHASPA